MARRIGRIVLFVVAAALLVLPPCLIAHPIAYVPLLSAVLMLVVSWAYLQVMRRSLSVSVAGMASACERGHASQLSVTLSNRAPLPCARVQMDFFVTDLFGDYDGVRTVACSTRARDDVDVDFDVLFAHVGTYHAGVTNVVVYDLLGLFSAKLSDGARRQVTVRPRKMSLGAANAMTAVPDESRRSLKPVAADDVDYANVREYRFGDSLKTIHWNLTARDPGHTMFTRLYETYVNPSLTVVLDSCGPDVEAEELMSLMDGIVEVAVALCEQARVSGIDAEVRYVNRAGRDATGHLVSTFDAVNLVTDMMRITPEREAGAVATQAEELLRRSGLRSQGSGNIALVTSRVDPGQIATLAEVAMARRNAMAFVAVPRGLAGREREKHLGPLLQLSGVGGAWWAVESNEIASEVVGL